MLFICPQCQWEHDGEQNWKCSSCQVWFDTFETRAKCPECGTSFPDTRCPNCDVSTPHPRWYWCPRCPDCGWKHTGGARWSCPACQTRVDIFETAEECPKCGRHLSARCPECDHVSAPGAWLRPIDDGPIEDAPITQPSDSIGGRPLWQCPGPDGIVPRHRMTWICMRLAWLVLKMGWSDLENRRLRLPSDRGTPSFELPRDRIARTYLDHLLLLADLDPGDVELEYLENPESSDGVYFGADDVTGRHVIAVGRKALEDPPWLRAMLSHEISHYWIHTVCGISNPYPIDHEALTDLTAVYLGFGVFLFMSSVPYQHHAEAGGKYLEYLSSEEQSLALALYVRLKHIDENSVLPFVRPAVAKNFRRHVDYLTAYPQIVSDVRERPDAILHGVEWQTFDE
jgi:hypothetical protein